MQKSDTMYSEHVMHWTWCLHALHKRRQWALLGRMLATRQDVMVPRYHVKQTRCRHRTAWERRFLHVRTVQQG